MREYMDEVLELVDLSQNRPLNEIVYEGLRKAIILGVIPVGEHINEKVYADYMNISRTPMRRAIERLKKEDIIEYIPHYGVVVKRVTESDAQEIYTIRTALDKLAFSSAVDLMDDEDHEEVAELLVRIRAVDRAGEIKEAIHLTREFNSYIYRYARMPRLTIVVKQLQAYLARFRDIALLDDARREIALREHEEMAEMLRNKEKEALEELVESHLAASQNFVIQEIKVLEEQLLRSIEEEEQKSRL